MTFVSLRYEGKRHALSVDQSGRHCLVNAHPDRKAPCYRETLIKLPGNGFVSRRRSMDWSTTRVNLGRCGHLCPTACALLQFTRTGCHELTRIDHVHAVQCSRCATSDLS